MIFKNRWILPCYESIQFEPEITGQFWNLNQHIMFRYTTSQSFSPRDIIQYENEEYNEGKFVSTSFSNILDSSIQVAVSVWTAMVLCSYWIQVTIILMLLCETEIQNILRLSKFIKTIAWKQDSEYRNRCLETYLNVLRNGRDSGVVSWAPYLDLYDMIEVRYVASVPSMADQPVSNYFQGFKLNWLIHFPFGNLTFLHFYE